MIQDEKKAKSEREDFTDTLLTIFEDKVLASHKTNFVQYILAYVASLPTMEVFRQKFLSFLLLQAFDPKLFPSKRIVLLEYLGSFLAACDFLEPELVVEAMRIFVSEFRQKLAPFSKPISVHALQALLTVFCYRFDTLKTDRETMLAIMESLLPAAGGLLGQMDSEVLKETLTLLRLQEVVVAKNAVATVETAIGQQAAETAVPISVYMYFSGILHLPILQQKLDGKLGYLTHTQKAAMIQTEDRESVTTTPMLSPRKLMGKKRRDSVDMLDDSTCINMGMKVLAARSPNLSFIAY